MQSVKVAVKELSPIRGVFDSHLIALFTVFTISHQNSPFPKFTIDGHSGILRVKPGETLDYETTPTYFVTVVAKVRGHHFLPFGLSSQVTQT